jgi:hypothetical protein
MDSVEAYIKRKNELVEIEKTEREQTIQKLGSIFPHIGFSHNNNLGESISFHLSLEPKEKWSNGIFHNSNYMIFMIHADENKLTMIGNGTKSDNFRKCKVKSFERALEKIADYGTKAKEAIK